MSLTASGSYDNCDFLFFMNVSVDIHRRIRRGGGRRKQSDGEMG